MPNSVERDLPMVSIGVPVYNEEKFIALALNSLRAQDYPRIEIIVSDNASADSTAEICEEIAALDARIRVIRAKTNEGSTANFQRCLDAANGELFMWAGGHDLWSNNFVSQCVSVLTRYQDAVIAVPESDWIDTDSRSIGRYASTLDTRDMARLARVFSLLWANMHAMYGVARTAALRACGPIPNYLGADLVWLLRMILQGDFVPASQAVWSRRLTRTGENYQTRQKRYRSPEFGIGKAFIDRLMPIARVPFEVLKTVWSSDLPIADKLAFTFAFLAQIPARYLVARRRVI